VQYLKKAEFMWNTYYQVKELNQALSLLDKFKADAKLVAGATDLWLEFERGLHGEVRVLIDVSRIKDLDKIVEDEYGNINIGPLVTHSHVVRSELIKEYAYCLHQACASVGSPQIRNRGTLVGNVTTASPANDTIAPLMALNAIVVASTSSGSREIPINQFYTGVRKHILTSSEMITCIKFKKLEKDTHTSFFIKHGLRKAQSISLLNMAVIYKVTQPGILSDMRIAIGAAAPTVVRATAAEKYAEGKRIGIKEINRIGKMAAQTTSPIDDLRSSAEYRVEMAEGLLKRELMEHLIDKKKQKPPVQVTLWGAENTAFVPLTDVAESSNGSAIEFILNNQLVRSTQYQGKSLLDIIREDGHQKGSKEGCGEGECGACTVFMDGIAVLACLIPAERAHKSTIITIEGLSAGSKITKLQQSFIDEGAVQCGFCTPGFVMSGTKLLEEVGHPTHEQINIAISGNLCRCTGYYKIVNAIKNAAE
jgi:carbon-monoxide dehydrogenase medium subunit